MSHKLFTGDSIEVLKSCPDNSIDSCITDPPYGMGMEHWDHSVPTVEIWQEVKRVLKPGGFCLSFCSPQLYHRMATAVDESGLLIKDQIIWMITTKMAKKNGLKPAHEPIVVAQKKPEGSIQANFDKWGTGIVDTDNNRTPWEGKPPTGWVKGGHQRRMFGKSERCASPACRHEFTKEEKYFFAFFSGLMNLPFGCPKCGHDKISGTTGTQAEFGTEDANPKGRIPMNIIGYFNDPKHQKYFYAPRVTRKERGEFNDHPTPKPISLMTHLVRLFTPAGGVVLDPFCGSGSTGIAALNEGRKFIGIDLEQHYIDITEKRIELFVDKKEKA